MHPNSPSPNVLSYKQYTSKRLTEGKSTLNAETVLEFQDLLWSDPDQYTQGWARNSRGVSYVFGADVVKKFCRDMDLDLIARAHQVVQDGYEFFADRRLVTIFSAPKYCGEFDNNAAVMIVSKNLECSFEVLKAMDNPPRVRARLKQPNAPPIDKMKRRKKKPMKSGVGMSGERVK
ncbi:hypothetical protein GCK32_008804 [Trichostrongylus colubriformis]|uniref:protein-serine/threonine phosphatase n=1 Tax=Trichostrongylus colubriformis TaxID=6319 RepID=A0AAN8IYD8_TRICO